MSSPYRHDDNNLKMCAEKNPLLCVKLPALCLISSLFDAFCCCYSDVTVFAATCVLDPWLNSSRPGRMGREGDSGEIWVMKHRCPQTGGVLWCWTEDCEALFGSSRNQTHPGADSGTVALISSMIRKVGRVTALVTRHTIQFSLIKNQASKDQFYSNVLI